MTSTQSTLSGQEIRHQMRVGRKTIRGLAASMNITQKRVRFVRENGVKGHAFVLDWLEALAPERQVDHD
jgi:hypothetical protein